MMVPSGLTFVRPQQISNKVLLKKNVVKGVFQDDYSSIPPCDRCDEHSPRCPKCGCDTCTDKVNKKDLFLCQECGKKYHSDCLTPPMSRRIGVCMNVWVCSFCNHKNGGGQNPPDDKKSTKDVWGRGMSMLKTRRYVKQKEEVDVKCSDEPHSEARFGRLNNPSNICSGYELAMQADVSATPFGLGSLGGLAGLGNMDMGSANFMKLQQMELELMNDPDMIRQMVENPVWQSMLNNPEYTLNLITSNPQIQQLMERNPEITHMLNNRERLFQTVELLRNPSTVQEFMRSHQRAMSNPEFIPDIYAPLCKRCDIRQDRCPQCGCEVCSQKGQVNKLLVCNTCKQKYHPDCLSPPMNTRGATICRSDWVCSNCKHMNGVGQNPPDDKESAKGVRGRGMSKFNTKTYGSVKQSPYPGAYKKQREEVSEAGVHQPRATGTHGLKFQGVHGIVLSRSNKDDVACVQESMCKDYGNIDQLGRTKTADQSRCDIVKVENETKYFKPDDTSLFKLKRCIDWFKKYTTPDEPDVLGPEGMIQFCADIGVDPEDPLMLVLAFKMNAQDIGSFTMQEWVTGLGGFLCDTAPKLQNFLVILERMLKDEDFFKTIYIYAFKFACGKNKRHLDIEKSKAMLEVLLAKKWSHLDLFKSFLDQSKYTEMNRDQWTSLLTFSRVFCDVSDYDQNSAWPVMIDEFVEWLNVAKKS